jgi:pyrroline-5-carboxylate reductase
MPQTQAIVDTSVLEEVVHWVKSLTAVGVSPDTAATITSQFFLAACEMIAEEGDDDEEMDEDFEE